MATRLQKTTKQQAFVSASVSKSFATLPAAGSFIIAYVAAHAGIGVILPGQVTDNQGNGAYESLIFEGASSPALGIFYKANIGAPSGTFTVTFTPLSSSNQWIMLEEWGGMGAATILDSATAGGSSTTPGTGATSALTPAAGGALAAAISGIIAATSSYVVESVSPAWDEVDQQLGAGGSNIVAPPGEADSRVVFAPGAYSCSWTSSDSGGWRAGIVVFAPEIIEHGRIEIDGEDVTGEIVEADVELPLNRQATGRLLLGDGVIPARGAPVLVYARDGVTPLFGGIILVRRVDGMTPSSTANKCECELVDWSVYFDDASVTLIYGSPQDLEDVIADIVTQALAVYDITYAPTATGITVPPIEWRDITVADAFKRITDATGIVFRVLPLKELDVFVPLTRAAPVDITDATINAFDLQWNDPPNLPRNTVDLLCGPTGNGLATQVWTKATGETSWEVDIAAAAGGWQQGYVFESDGGGVARTVSLPSDGNGYYFWDEADGKGTISVGVGVAPADGSTLTFVYTAIYPFHARVSSGSPPAPPVVFREAHPEILTLAAGLALATEILDREIVDGQELAVFTDVDGFLPGQALTIDTVNRGGLDDDYLVASVDVHPVNPEIWEYRLTCQRASEYKGSFVEQWKSLTSNGGSGTSAGTAPPPLVEPGAGVAGDIYSDGRKAFIAAQSMGGHKLTNVTDPSSNQDAATKKYVDDSDGAVLATVSAAAYIKKDGSIAFTGDQSLGSHKLTNVTDPSNPQDAATKAYVDSTGSGDVAGQSVSVDKEIALFSGTTGKIIKRATGTGIVRVASGVYGTPGAVDLASEITGNLPSANLGTTGTPQFARVGIGVAADANAALKIAGQYGAPLYDAGNSSTAITLDWNNGNTQLLTLTGACTIALSNPKDGFRYLIALKQDGTGSRIVTWPSSVKWAAGTAPTLSTTAGKVDIVTLVWVAGIGASGNYLAAANIDYTPA